MSRSRILFMRRAISDMAIEYYERWPALSLSKDIQCVLDAIDVIGVADAQHVPSIGQEPGGNILGKSDVGLTS